MDTKTIKDQIQSRSRYNTLLIEKVSAYLNKHPELRFIQALWALGIIDGTDKFYEESIVTYNRINKNEINEKN